MVLDLKLCRGDQRSKLLSSGEYSNRQQGGIGLLADADTLFNVTSNVINKLPLFGSKVRSGNQIRLCLTTYYIDYL